MAEKRKIAMVVNKLTFKEAEEADDLYWANTTAEFRLKSMMKLRESVYGNLIYQPIKKVVYKRNIHDIDFFSRKIK